MIFDDIELSSKARLLEIGCGTGVQAFCLSTKFSFVIASDVRNIFRVSSLKNTSLMLMKCSGENIPFMNGFFDIVFSSHVLEHVQIDKVLPEIKRVLKPNGLMICSVPTAFWKMLQMILHYPKMMPSKLISKTHPRLDPEIHGNYESNFAELDAYRPVNWIRSVNKRGFRVFRTKKLFLYATLGDYLRSRNISIVPPWLHMEKVTGFYSSLALYAKPFD